ncbi:MAG: biosis protein MshQ [Betaproteobacteria bacterium]|jgi:hypothetical protein|nr:biosis protein MshQ [Betaproteobacteria bacterium]
MTARKDNADLRKRTLALVVGLVALALVPAPAPAQIAFRASSTVTSQSVAPLPPIWQAIGASDTGVAAVSPSWPAHQVDDIGLLICESAGTEAVTLATPNGFAAVPSGAQTTGTIAAGTTITVFWARATSAAMPDPITNDPGDHIYCRISTYRNVINAGNPWNVTAGAVKAATSTAANVTGVTTTVDNTLIVQAISHNFDGAGAQFSAQANASLVGLAERGDAGTTSGNGGGFAVWDGSLATAGASGTTTATIANSTVNAFVTIALVPAQPITPIFQAAGGAVNNATSVSPTWPVHAVDDVALLFCESSGGNAQTLATAATFQAIGTQTTGAGTAGTRLGVWWARATSTAMGAPTITVPGDHIYCQIITYRGVVDSGNPYDVFAGGTKAAASISVTVTGVTTTTDNTLIVQAVARDTDAGGAAFSAITNANLTSILERNDAGTTTGLGGGTGVWDGGFATAGATGNTTATVASSINAFMTIALLPAGAGPKIGVPAGTVAGDLMVAAIAVQPSGVVMTEPAGWIAQPATVNAAVNSSRQQIFYRFADAADVAGGVSYVWTFGSSANGVAGGIVSYQRVDALSASPIDVFGGNTTASGTSHQATSVTTTVPNTMVISTHSFTSSQLWTPPGGMTERVDISTLASGNAGGISLGMNEVIQAAAAATGNKTATVAANGDSGVAHLLALRPALHHYAISAVTTTVANCDYAEISITGHASNDSAAAPAATRTVTLSVSAGAATAVWQAALVSGGGTWTPSGATATYQWSGTETSFTVRLRQSAVTTLSVDLSDTTGTPTVTEGTLTEDPAFSFVNSAFRISDGANAALSIGTQIAAKPSNTGTGAQNLFLQAVRTDTSTGACTSVFSNGADVAVQVGAQCINPASPACTQNVTLTTNSPSSNSGTFIPAGSASFPATINFRFTTANAEAPFNFSYADAGQIRLQFNYVSAAPAVTITGNSNNFVVRPFGLAFRGASAAAAVQHGTDQNSAVLVPAGDTFTMTIAAYKWVALEDDGTGNPLAAADITDNGITPNFTSAVIVAQSANLAGAAGRIARGAGCPVGAATIAASEFLLAGVPTGVATVADWCYTEVGNVLLTATASNYITAGVTVTGNSGLDDTTGTNGHVGRFRPKQFAITGTPTLTNRAALGCSSSFTYMSERLDLGFTLTAQNTQGNTTQNYTGVYAKLGAPTFANLNVAARSGATNLTSPTQRVDPISSAGSWSNGDANVTLQTGIVRAASPDGPYASVNFGIAPLNDSVAMDTFDLNIGGSNDRKNIGVTGDVRFGRLRLLNAAAPQGVDLPITLTAQHWNGSVFITNANDGCTSLVASNMSLGSYTGGTGGISAVNMGTGHIVVGGVFAAGVGSLKLTKSGSPPALTPAATIPGATTLTIDLAAEGKTYLQGAWGGATYTFNPSARASWGLFGSQPQNFIYQRETY